MASIEIFKCDICGKEHRLDKTPHIERGAVLIDASEFQRFEKVKFSDSCADCASSVHYGVLEIVQKLRSLVKTS
jgi:hypothetical protein